jgi:hypothetical protein
LLLTAQASHTGCVALLAVGRAGARVVAVELHPGRAARLRHQFPEVTVVHADATSLRLPSRPFRVVASPPYGITAGLLGLLLRPGLRGGQPARSAGKDCHPATI